MRAITLGIRGVWIVGVVLLALYLVDFEPVPSAIVLAVAVVVFVLIPWRARLALTRRLLEVRKAVQRDMERRTLPRGRRPRTILRLADSGVRHVRDVTLLQALVFKALTKGGRAIRHEAKATQWETSMKSFGRPRVRKRLRTYELRWKNAVVIHLFVGTPLGWIVGGLGAIVLGVMVLIRVVTRPSLWLAKRMAKGRLRGTRESLTRTLRYEFAERDEKLASERAPAASSPALN